MPVMIQIRNVPDSLHRKLKARAAQAHMSLSAYLLRDLERSAERPTEPEWRRKIAALEPIAFKETPAEIIRKMRDRR